MGTPTDLSKYLRIAIPNKGRLRSPSLRLLEESGITPTYDPSSRSLITPTNRDGIYLVYVRAEDVPMVVEAGAADLGITGYDLVRESGARVDGLLDLGFGRAKLVLAVPANSGVEQPGDLRPGSRVATKFTSITRDFFREMGLSVEVINISGAAEAMPSLGAAEAIVDVTSTGTTLALHGLKPIYTIMESSARLIGGPTMSDKGRMVEEVVESVRGVVTARKVKLIMMNVPDSNLQEVLGVLPSMSGPMIAQIKSSEPMWEVMTAVPLAELPSLVVELRRKGARDIIAVDVERLTH